jgi:hypothetical protein
MTSTGLKGCPACNAEEANDDAELVGSTPTAPAT